MRRALIAATGTALLLTPLGVAQAQDANAPLTVAIDVETCGEATITYTSTNTLPYSGDYRVGDEAGEADSVPADLLIEEGPLAGQPFGLVFNPTPIPANSVVPVIVDFEEDQGGGKTSLSAWVNRGPEQNAFAATVTADVDTDCAPPVTTPPVEPPVVEEDETPVDDDADDTADADDDLPSLPNEAPRPTVVVGGVPVTG